MVDYREILRLHSLGNSNRQISEATRSSHHTITDVINAAEEKNIVWPLNEDMTNRKLQGYRSCASLSRLGDRYGAIKLENACTRMLNISSNPSVRNISSLLKNYVESDELKSSDVRKETGGGITRGASAFAIGGSKR